jgi:hypothetical protein
MRFNNFQLDGELGRLLALQTALPVYAASTACKFGKHQRRLGSSGLTITTVTDLRKESTEQNVFSELVSVGPLIVV